MKRLRRIAAWAAVCAVMALAALTPETRAGLRREQALRARYGGWAGVLRLWAFEGWQCGSGSLAAWLNDRVAAFEKRHGGVYIQLTMVDEETLRGFTSEAVGAPDMLLFPPGLLDSLEGLLALPDDWPLREGLEVCGKAGDCRYALPVAIGAYGIACNRAMLDGLPADWRALPEKPASGSGATWLSWPEDSAYLRWSRAMDDLLTPAPEGEEAREPPVGEGLDLGLPVSGGAAVLPNSFQPLDSVFARFARGEIAAMPVTQREIARLRLLSESGRAPDWAVAARASAYTDQIALLAATDCARRNSEERQALCLAFAALLLSDESQARLAGSRAFTAIEAPPLYAGMEGMAQLEAGLAGLTLDAPPAFGG